MKRCFILALAALGLVACAPSPAETNLAHLARAGGYQISSGATTYKEDRWTLLVKVENCANVVKLGGERAPKTWMPTQYEILEIDGKSLADIDPAMDRKNRPAPEIRMIPGIAVLLGC